MTDNMEEATLRGSVTAINNDLSVEVVQRAEGDLAAHLRIDGTLSQLTEQHNDVLSKYLDVKNTQGMDHLELVNYLNALSTDIGNSLFQLNQSIELERDTRVAKYTELHEDVQKYVQMLSDITMDSQQITMDSGDIRLGAWTILSQAREWDLEILTKIANLKTSTQTELNVALDEFQAQLPTKENIISDAIEQLSNAPIITNLDNLLASNIADITVLSGQLLTEVASIQQTAMANAQEAADNLQLRVSEIQGQVLAEEAARIDAMVRESAIRASTIQQASDDMQEQVDVETTARLAAIGLLNDGLTTETQNRIDGDAATLSVINNYKTSNDLALANINQTLTTAVTDNSATAQQITALDTRLTDTAQVASTAVSKADSAITANTALASTVDSLTLSLADTATTTQSNSTALSELTSDIAIQDGKLTSQGSDITDLQNSVTGINGSLANKADSSALTATNNRVTATENSISTQATEITSLKGSVETYTTNISAAQTAANNAATLAGNRGKVLFQATEPELTDRLIQNLWIDTTNGTNTPKRWLTNDWVAVTDKAASDALAAANAANTALSTKADSAALTELINQVDVVDGKTTTNASSITDLTGRVTTTENELTTKVDAVVLVNYYTKTEAESATAGQIATYNSNLVLGGVNQLFDSAAERGGEGNTYFVYEHSKALYDFYEGNIGKEVTISLEIKTPVIGTVAIFAANLSAHTFYGMVVVPTANEWQRVELTTVIQRHLTNPEQVQSSALEFIGLIDGCIPTVRKVQLERGNKASAWSPSPRDYTQSLSELQDTNEANANAIQEVSTDVSAVDGKVTTQGNAITSLQNDLIAVNDSLATKAAASALSSLESRVSANEGSTTSQGESITDLSNSLTTTITDVAAAQSAADNAMTEAGSKGKVLFQSTVPGMVDRYAQNLWIDTAANANTPKRWNGLGWVAVTDKVATDAAAAAQAANTAITTKADATAVNSLTTRVTEAEGVNTSQGQAITNLQTSLTTTNNAMTSKADASALNELTSEVATVDGKVESNTTNITNLTGRVITVEGSVATKAEATVLNNYYTKTDADTAMAGNIATYNASLKIGGNNLIYESRLVDGYLWQGVGYIDSPDKYDPTYYECSANEAFVGTYYSANGQLTGSGGYIEFYTAAQVFISGVEWIIADEFDSKFITAPDNAAFYRYATIAAGIKAKLERGTKATDWSPNVDDLEASVTANANALSTMNTEVVRINDVVIAKAELLDQISTTIDGNTAAIAVQGNSIDGIKAEYSIKLDVNGLVSGIGLINNGTSSAIGINANYFYVGSPTDNKKPFMINSTAVTINGVTYPAGTWIDTALMANASIGGAKIQNASIDTAQIKDAAITSAKIKDLTADKISVPTTAGVIDKLTATNATITGTSLSGTSALYDGNFKSGSSYASFGSGSGAGTGVETSYLQVDLKALKRIQDISMWYYCADGRKYYYKVKVSKDGTNWDYLVGDSNTWALSQEVYKINDSYSNTTTVERINSPGMYFRYLRIYGDGNTVNTGNHLYELSVSSQPISTVIDGNGILSNSITTSKLSADVFTTIAADGSKSTIEGGTFKVHYPNGNLAVFIGVS